MKQLSDTRVFENKLKYVCTGSFAFTGHSQNQLLLILCIHGPFRHWKTRHQILESQYQNTLVWRTRTTGMQGAAHCKVLCLTAAILVRQQYFPHLWKSFSLQHSEISHFCAHTLVLCSYLSSSNACHKWTYSSVSLLA